MECTDRDYETYTEYTYTEDMDHTHTHLYPYSYTYAYHGHGVVSRSDREHHLRKKEGYMVHNQSFEQENKAKG